MTATADVGSPATPPPSEGAGTVPDPGKVVEMALRVWGYKQGEVVSLMIHLGDRLGIYRALDGAGPVTTGDLAARLAADHGAA
jgi:hypothetical protein